MTSPLALFLPDLAAGGAERVMLTLAGEFPAAGRPVDLVVANTGGALRTRIPSGVRLIDPELCSSCTCL